MTWKCFDNIFFPFLYFELGMHWNENSGLKIEDALSQKLKPKMLCNLLYYLIKWYSFKSIFFIWLNNLDYNDFKKQPSFIDSRVQRGHCFLGVLAHNFCRVFFVCLFFSFGWKTKIRCIPILNVFGTVCWGLWRVGDLLDFI